MFKLNAFKQKLKNLRGFVPLRFIAVFGTFHTEVFVFRGKRWVIRQAAFITKLYVMCHWLRGDRQSIPVELVQQIRTKQKKKNIHCITASLKNYHKTFRSHSSSSKRVQQRVNGKRVDENIPWENDITTYEPQKFAWLSAWLSSD